MEDLSELIKIEMVLCSRLILLLTSSVSHRHVQNAFDPPILLSKVAAVLCPVAGWVQVSLVCAQPP